MSYQAGPVTEDAYGLSASCLCYLFADQFMRPLGRWQRILGAPGVLVPSSGVVVSLGSLEVHLLAVGLWDLKRNGFIRLWCPDPGPKPIMHRHLDPKDEPLSLQVIPERTSTPAPGLEGELLAALGNCECDLYELLVNRWLGGATLALNGVIVVAQREALSRGILRRARKRPSRLPRSLQWAQSLRPYVGDRTALKSATTTGKQMADHFAILSTRDPEWKALLRETGNVLYRARPFYRVDGSPGP